MTSGSDYEIVFDHRAEKDIKHLWRGNPNVYFTIRNAIDNLSQKPFSRKALKGKKKGCYSLKKGKFRVIYEVHTDKKIIHVIKVGHRKDIYR